MSLARRRVSGAGGLALLLSLGSLSAHAQETTAFDLPAQSLSSALLEVSRQANVTLFTPSPLVRGKRALALRGRMSAVEAVARLLDGQGLDYAVSPDGAITIRALRHEGPRRPPSPAPRPEPLTPTLLSGVEVIAPRGVDQALRIKRQATPSSDILLDADLRSAPEAGLGGAMVLLPGVSVSSDAGEARQVSVRGVGGEFTRARINGMETLATFGGPNAGGGTNRGRAFDFNVFAADLFKQIRLQKTPSADLDEGSLGATIDLRTRSPFDGPARQARLTAEAVYSQGGRQLRPKVSGVFSRRSQDDRWGVLLSGAYGQRSTLDVGTSAVQWQSGDTAFPGFGSRAATAPSLTALNAALHPRIPRLEILAVDQTRYGATASLQWRPDPRSVVAFDLLYSRLDAERREDLLGTFTFRTAGACAAPAAPTCGLAAVQVRDATLTTPRPGLTALVAGTFDNVDVRAESRRDVLRTEFRQATLTAGRQLTDRLAVRALIGASRSDFSNPVQDTLQLDQYDVQGFGYDFRDPRRPVISFGSAALNSASAWRLAELRTEPNWVDNSYRTVGLDLDWNLAPGWRLQGGVQAKRYRTYAASLARSDGSIANTNPAIAEALLAVPAALYLRTVGSSGLGAGGDTPTAWLAPDVALAMTLLKAACAQAACGAFDLGPEPLLGLNYTVAERDTAAYGQLSFEAVGPWRLRGDLGLRHARTRQTSSGYTLDPAAPAFVSQVAVTRRYDDWLPSLSLAAEPGRDLVLRLGLARVMARPDLRSLRPGITVSTGGLRSVSQGAPFLRPTRADALDLALEWYFAPEGLVSLAYFHKTLRTGIQTTATAPTTFDRNPFGLPDSVATTACGRLVGCAPDLPIWQFLVRTDQGGGRLDGGELAIQAPLTLMVPALRRWSLKGALTYTRPRLRYFGLDGAAFTAGDSLGAPRLVSNLSLIYRRDEAEARATLAHRGAYLTAIPAPTGGDVDGVNALTTLDVSARCRFGTKAWLTATGANLLNAANRQFSDTSQLANYQHRTGREFRIGIEMVF